MTARTLAAMVTVVLMATAACGGTPPGNGGPPTTTSSAPPTTNGDVVTATGTVLAGVEPGCLILDTDAKRYLLIDGDRPLLKPGRRVVVRGIPRPGIPTTCMQGFPLEVRDVQPAT